MLTAVQMRDRAPLYMRDRASAFYAPQQLGKTRYLTPEGYLVCEGVPIARTGEQAYQESELNPPGSEITVRGNSDGIVIVKREPEEVFRTETIASFEGKPITVEHPNDFVTPESFKQHAVGHMQHVRRGEGIEDDLLLADFVITDPEAIAYVNRALPEVSAGYTADYDPQEPGTAFQRNIFGNHAALVERGRAGPRVSVRDHLTGEPRMKLRDLMKALFPTLPTNDAAAVQAALDSDVPGVSAPTPVPTADSAVLAELKALSTRLDTMDAQIKKLATKDEEEETEEERKKREAEEAAKKSEDEAAEEIKKQEETGDTVLEAEGPGAVVNLGSVYTGDSASGGALDVLKEVNARAEILAPGITIPTKDSLKGNKGAALATFMRTALERCATTDSGKDAIGTFLGGRKIGDLKGHALLGVFNGAANLVSARNNRATTSVTQSSVRTGDFSKPSSITSINEANRKFWANGGKP